MHDATAYFWGSLPKKLLALLGSGHLTVLSGPPGSGKELLLREVETSLSRDLIPTFRCTEDLDSLATHLSSLERTTVVLLEEMQLASLATLETLGNYVLNGGIALCTLTDTKLNSAYANNLEQLSTAAPLAHAVFTRSSSVTMPTFGDASIAKLAHGVSPQPLDQVAIESIQWLSWGRAGWAVDLIKHHERGHFSATPYPSLSSSAEPLTQSRIPGAGEFNAHEHLNENEIAAAIVLAEIGPRSLGGITDIIGAQSQSRLTALGFITPRPTSTTALGVPEITAVALYPLASPEPLRNARISAALHLMTQEAFGIPLNSREANFCTLALDSETIANHPNLGEHHSAFLLRTIGDMIAFGDGNRARDIMLRLGKQGPQLSSLTRARISTVLRDAPTGLQTILASAPPAGNGDDPIPHSHERIAMLMLRGRLAAESGFAFTTEPRSTPSAAHGRDHIAEHSQWDDTHLVIQRWNDTEPLGEDLIELIRIAQEHPQPEIALLAEALVAFEASTKGAEFVLPSHMSMAHRTTQLSLNAGEDRRDVVESLAVAQSLSTLLTSRSDDQEAAFARLIEHLPGASFHQIWATHLSASRTAFLCGDLPRAKMEWSKFAAHVPRFIPFRLSSYIDSALTPFLGKGEGSVELVETEVGQIVAYFGGYLDRTREQAFTTPQLSDFIPTLSTPTDSAPSRLNGVEMRELSTFSPIRAHLSAMRQSNPVALLRAADSLEKVGLWGPAVTAVSAARRIFLRRRASGSVTQADIRLKDLAEKAAQVAPWFEFLAPHVDPKEQLTPRETTTASYAAQGLSNREIADLMRCSVRTVESHLAQARAKLGAADRTELTTVFAALNPDVTIKHLKQHARS